MENYFNKKIIVAFIFIAIVMVVLTPLWINQLICGVFFIILPLTLIICYTIVICKKMKIDAKSEKQTTAYTQKEKWEKSQYDLYRAENEKRSEYEKTKQKEQFEFEKEKWIYDKIEAIAKEFNKEKLPEDEIKAIKDEIEKLKKQNETQLRVNIIKEEKTKK